ncbi:MAG: hypothetical protein HYZ75_01180 [Elusimicrobia bacterium]|nr:hypothetical protein [Elusimicrobiota bacterium]
MKPTIPRSLEDAILASLNRRGRGCVVFGENFFSLASPEAVRQALSRLAHKGTLRRIATGLYHFPEINERLGGELPPSMETAARAIARRTGSRIVATGAQAANLLGLSTQVPAKPIYLTDGTSRRVAVGDYAVTFRHAGPRRMAIRHDISVLLFEALRYIGRANVDDQVVARLRDSLPPEAKAELRRDLSRASIWMRPIVRRVTE